MAVMDKTHTAPAAPYIWQGPQVPSTSTTVVADAVQSTSITVDAAAYHRELAYAFEKRPKAPDDKPLDFDPDNL